MKATRKDPNNYFMTALRMAGLQVDAVTTELILNIKDLVDDKKGSVNIKDVIAKTECVKGLFDLDDVENLKKDNANG